MNAYFLAKGIICTWHARIPPTLSLLCHLNESITPTKKVFMRPLGTQRKANMHSACNLPTVLQNLKQLLIFFLFSVILTDREASLTGHWRITSRIFVSFYVSSLSKSEPRKSACIPFFWLMRIDQEMNEILRQQSNRTILLDNKTSEWQVKKNKDNAPPTAKKWNLRCRK